MSFNKCGFFAALKYGSSNDPPQALVDPCDPGLRTTERNSKKIYHVNSAQSQELQGDTVPCASISTAKLLRPLSDMLYPPL